MGTGNGGWLGLELLGRLRSTFVEKNAAKEKAADAPSTWRKRHQKNPRTFGLENSDCPRSANLPLDSLKQKDEEETGRKEEKKR